jgi:dolichol-phosphate mannosyltransferase
MLPETNAGLELRAEVIEPGPELTVIVPTRNERDNVGPMVAALATALPGIRWEAIFVDDDSTDGTGAEVRRLATLDRRIRLVHRIGRRGLSSACIEGIQASAAPYVAIIDGDLQHDERVLPQMLAVLRAEPIDIVVGSRYVDGGGVGEWDARRVGMSAFATKLGQWVLRVPLADPMSGFFMIRRDAFDRAVRRLSAIGFKILIDILASSPTPLRVRELPYVFRNRLAGESKLDAFVAWEYLMLLGDKLFGHLVPIRFAVFGTIGVIGIGVHLTALSIGLRLPAGPEALAEWIREQVPSAFGFDLTEFMTAGMAAQGGATLIAMVFNFTLNNLLTYSDRRLKGWGFWRGLVSFCAVCSVGLIPNVSIFRLLQGSDNAWWIAGIAGALMSSVWNYAVSAVVTWRRK